VGSVIGRLRGVWNNGVVDTAGGVGYVVVLSHAPDEGADVDLVVSTHWREGGVSMYGFANSDERDVFDALCRVNRVGPAAAMSLVRTHGAGRCVAAVRAKDPSMLAGASGVGRKTAEMICTLATMPDHLSGEDGEVAGDDLVEALAAMGFDHDEARRALAGARNGGGEDEADVLRRALADLSGAGR
jgi:holliday junction DNA helicase RuvA